MASPDWAALPKDALVTIASRVADIAELACFGAVCPSWRSAAFAATLRRPSPWFLLPGRRLFSFAGGRSCPFPSPAADAAADGCELFASPNGMLLAVKLKEGGTPILSFPDASPGEAPLRIPNEGIDALSMSLINPFDGDTILRLPSAPFILNSAFGWDVSPQGVVVVAGTCLPGYRIGYKHPWMWRPGDAEWTSLDSVVLPVLPLDGMSVSYSENKFFLFDCGHRKSVTVIELDSTLLSVAAVIKLPYPKVLPGSADKDTFFAVAAGGKLLMLVRSKKHQVEFWEADYQGEETVWNKVSEIGEHAVFLNGQRALMVDARDLAFRSKMKKGGIYSACLFPETQEEGINVFAVVTKLKVGNGGKLVYARAIAAKDNAFSWHSTAEYWMMLPRKLVPSQERQCAASTSSG